MNAGAETQSEKCMFVLNMNQRRGGYLTEAESVLLVWLPTDALGAAHASGPRCLLRPAEHLPSITFPGRLKRPPPGCRSPAAPPPPLSSPSERPRGQY